MCIILAMHTMLLLLNLPQRATSIKNHLLGPCVQWKGEKRFHWEKGNKD